MSHPDTPPPQTQQRSPQASNLDPPSAAGSPVPGISAQCFLPLSVMRRCSMSRERLSDWHSKIRGKLFPLVAGFFVRCRVEDGNDGKAAYKVGRIKSLKPDWSVELALITDDEKKAGKNNTNYDCLSNSEITLTEFKTWEAKLSADVIPDLIEVAHKVEERLRMIETILFQEPAFLARKKDAKSQPPGGDHHASPTSAASAAASSQAPQKLVFSQNVLLIEDGLTIPQSATLLDLLTNAVGQKGISEPDTPRQSSLEPAHQQMRPMKPRTFDEAVASNSTMISFADVKAYGMRSPAQCAQDPLKILDLLRRSANQTFTEFRYDNLPEFARLILSVCSMARDIFAKESLYLHLCSPICVFGDIHGNFADMYSFLEHIVAFDDVMMRYTTTNLLFLGDYVDRGNHGVECIMYLLALKCIAPNRVFLLRGNHESPEVNGDIDVYSFSSFKYQCLERFGREKGMEVWVAINEVFQYLPVVAEIDKQIFCVHGGLPQYSGGEDNRLEILSDNNFPRVPIVQCNDPSNAAQRIIVNDLLWSDPAQPGGPVDKWGFGPNARGPDIKTFGSKAVDMFCERYGFQYIFRAHQEKADGVRLSDNARVVTIFSTSDYAGHQNGAGCILVANGKIRMAIKKPCVRTPPEPRQGTVSPRTLNRGLPGFVPRVGRK